jgi:hypothetical protein
MNGTMNGIQHLEASFLQIIEGGTTNGNHS